MTTTMSPAVLEELKGRKIGRVLSKLGVVSREQVHEALAAQTSLSQKGSKKRLGEILVELGYCGEADIRRALAGQAGLEFVDLAGVVPEKEAIDAVPADNARAYQIVPLAYNAKTKRLKIAMKTPDNLRAIDDLRLLLGATVEAVVGDSAQIDRLLDEHYKKQESITDVVSGLAKDQKFDALQGRGTSIDLDQLNELSGDNQVVKLLNLVLMQAIKDRASDIHFEPFENEFKMRYRIDGVLYEMVPPPKHLGPAIVSRIKVMASLDIAEHRLPQDGRIELQIAGNPVDLRVAVLPTLYGESVVMRVLDRSNVKLEVDRVGLREDDLERVKQLIDRPNGIVIVTGPTGSGKTTTLYACLRRLNDIGTKLLTVEDPVEYDIDGLCQVQVNEEVGLTFARALRSFLRQDPDIILVGEIRDLETAQIAVQASLTGHLVLSTLHTNDAPSSIVRLIDLGMEPFLLTATIEGIIAQRLVRRVCSNCKTEYVPKEEELMELNILPQDVRDQRFFRGKGCDNCLKSGYKGRTALFEIMTMDDEIREMVMQERNLSEVRESARRKGMRTLRESGLLCIAEGITTIDEVVRETIVEE